MFSCEFCEISHNTLKNPFIFSTLIINFSEVWPGQILDLGKQFNLMIRLENVLKRSLEDILKMSWRRFCKTSWRRLEDVLARRLEDVFRTSWRRIEDVLKTFLQDVLKTFGRRLEDVLARRLEDGQDEYIDLDQDVLKTSWRRLLKTKTKDVFKTSSSRRMFAGTLMKIMNSLKMLSNKDIQGQTSW